MTIESKSTAPPRVTIGENPHAAFLEEVAQADNGWQARIRAGTMPGEIALRVDVPGAAAATASLRAVLDPRDRAGDGTPDFLRLYDPHDRESFRRWFTFLAEEQYFQPVEQRPAEINDCAALIRYAYREALHAHDSAWAQTARLSVVPAFDSVSRYQYPHTALGSGLFRTVEGPFRAADLANGAFAQFADAQTLWRFNTHAVGRDIARALPGDLLFYRQPEGHDMPFHSMIYLGGSQVRRDGSLYILYHTGPDGSDPGEMRRLTTTELLRFPQPEWRPVSGNPAFLGLYRWNILRNTDEDARHH